jgi:hypothetical protein
MKFIIQSFSDIITNSSSEVFISAPNEELMKILEDWGIWHKCYNTEEELRKAVENTPYDFDEITSSCNPYYNFTMIEDLKEIKSTDEIWEFFKSFYIDLIGKIIVDVDRDYLYTKQSNTGINIFDYVKE